MKLNWGLWWCLLACSVFFVSGCGGKKEREAAYIQKSQKYYREGNYEKAGVEIRNAIQINPKNAKSFFLAGAIDEKQHNWQKAFANYSQANELDPNELEAKARLGKFYLASGDFEHAEKMAKEIQSKDPTNVDGLLLQAAIALRKGSIDQSKTVLLNVLKRAPSRSDAYLLLANIELREGNGKGAQDLLERGLAATQANIELREMLAQVALKNDDLVEAERMYADLVRLQPKNVAYVVSLARFYSSTKQLDKAEKTLRNSIQLAPDDPERRLILADFLAETKGAGSAESELVRATNQYPSVYPLRFALAKLYEASGRIARAQDVYREIARLSHAGPDALKAETQLARILIQGGDTSQGMDLIGQVLKQNPRDQQALGLRAKVYVAQGKAKEAITDLRSLLKEQPDSPALNAMLAQAHLMNHEPQLAQNTLYQAVERYPESIDLRLALARLLLSLKDEDGALREIDAAIAAKPSDLRPLEAKLQLLGQKQQWEEAEKTAQKIKAVAPTQPEGDLALGRVYLGQKKIAQAITEYKEAVDKAPTSRPVLAALVNLLSTQGQIETAVTTLNNLVGANPNNIPAEMLLGEIEMKRGNLDAAYQAFQRVISKDPSAPGPYVDIAKVALAKKDTTDAVAWLQKGRARMPGNNFLTVALAQIFQQTGDRNNAILLYRVALKDDPRNDLAANNLASALIVGSPNKAQLDEALGWAGRFSSASNPAFLDTLGWTYYKRGAYAQAVRYLQNAVRGAPNDALFELHLGMALYRTGNISAGRELLRTSVPRSGAVPEKQEAAQMLAVS